MGKVKMKSKKYFDVQWGKPKMPDNVSLYFLKNSSCLSNDVWLEHTVGISKENLGEYDILDKWLTDTFEIEDGEEIFLSHWW